MRAVRASIRWRVAVTMIATALVTSLLFGLASFFFLYAIEDRMFADSLTEEVDRQQRAWEQRGAFDPPLRGHTSLYRPGEHLPADLQSQFDWAASQREYFGEADRHYHVERFNLPGAAGEALAVAEVSRFLVVRPRRTLILTLLAVMTVCVALFAGAVGYLLARRSVGPLTRLAQSVTSGQPGVPAIDPDEYPRNEIGLLATSLSQSFARIRSFVEREQAFTRDASHELRTPLAVIRSGAELASSGSEVPPRLRPLLARIIEAARDAEGTLDLLLALARDSAEAADGAAAPVLPLIEKAILDSSSRYDQQDIRVLVTVDPSLKIAMPQPATQLILNNLVGNAYQHAAGCELRISAGIDWIEIADTGPGLVDSIDPFEPFSKRSVSRGSGLGLNIVKRLSESSRIALSVSSGRPGTCFRLTFVQAAISNRD